MDGNRLINTLYDITFKQDKEHTVLCSKQLTQSEVAKFRKVSWVPASAWDHRGQSAAVRHKALAGREAQQSACRGTWAADSVSGTPCRVKAASCIHRQAALLLHAGCSSGCWRARLHSSAASWGSDSRCLPQARQHVSAGSAPVPGQSGQMQAVGSRRRVQKLLRLLLHGC